MPPPAWTPPPTAHRSRTALVGVGIVVGLLALGLVAKAVLFRSAIGFPDRLAGMSRDDSVVATQVTQMIEKISESMGFKVHVAVYGTTPAQPGLLVVAFERKEAPPGAFDEFASGFTSTSGAGVGQSLSETRGSTQYTCAPVLPSARTQATDPQSLCQWTDPDTGGFLASMTVGDANTALDLAEQVHDAVVR